MTTDNSHPQITLHDILNILKSQMPALAETHHVKSLGIFGPHAKGKARPRSRLQLLVEFDEAPSMFGFLRLREELAKTLGVKVDLVLKSTLRPEIGKRVMKELVNV